jgi:hypothetical protein
MNLSGENLFVFVQSASVLDVIEREHFTLGL